MKFKAFYLTLLLLLCQNLLAQTDTIAQIEEVLVTDIQLHNFSNSQSVQKLNDSVIGRNATSLTSLLQYNTVIYFKENGLGMVSSPSFRGTTAQQTAVIWNGININSQLNGQTDFNTINTRDFKTITARAGGGSVIYGSSAIGGSIHLNNDLSFGKKFDNELRTDYGSYNTLGLNYKLSASGEKYSANVSVSHNSSDNNYDFPGYRVSNDNGQYKNTSVNAAFAYKIDAKNILRIYSYLFDGNRHFSRTLAAPSRSMYDDFNTRNLFEWTGYYNRFTSRVKAAYLTESYKYYENFATNNHTFGKVKTFIGKYDATYDVTNNLKINAIADYTNNNGAGSDLVNKKRDILSGSVLLKHTVSKNFDYEAGIRKEITNAYESPVLFSGGAVIGITKWYRLKLNGSRNFRIPTFNDLYWQGSGNPYLKPESSYQAEVGNAFSVNNFNLTITGYYIRLHDMLRWIPAADGFWRPENIDRAKNYGAEALLNWEKDFGESKVTVTGTYAYTTSRRDGSNKQLIYVPKHKATAALAYSYKRFSAYYRHLFTGTVFFTTDNQSELDPYNVSGFGAEYTFKVLKGLSLGAQVNNLYNQEYQAVASRPMPGRNYNVYLNFKF
ncbi:MAG: TonB-dependent receptor [Bacteroidota bacterium]